MNKVCLHCKKQFLTSIRSWRKKYCSRICKSRFFNKKKITTFNCEICKKVFEKTTGNSKRRWCTKCSVVSCKCLVCNKLFELSIRHFNLGRGKFCTRKCANSPKGIKRNFGKNIWNWKGGINHIVA